MDLITIISYGEDIVALFGAIVIAASTVVAGVSGIVAKTKTLKDDAILAKIVKIIEYASIFNAQLKKKK